MTIQTAYIVSYDEKEWPMDIFYFATTHESAENVLVFERDKVELLMKSDLFKIIDEENDSSFQNFSEGYIVENDIKGKCAIKLKNCIKSLNDIAEKQMF